LVNLRRRFGFILRSESFTVMLATLFRESYFKLITKKY
jgi:hypothetical protein